MTRVAILGATGYTALELVKLLLRHPGAEITACTSRSEGRRTLASVHPSLTGRTALDVEDLAAEALAARADCVFSCLPHAASAKVIAPLLDAGLRVIDFSADYRLDDAATYRAWYREDHPDPARLGSVVYGLPEFFREQIVKSALVANPGCYPTSAMLPLAPLLERDLVDPSSIIVDAKSGVSGAGRTPKLGTLYPECNESLSAYGVGEHRHSPEIEQVLGRATGRKVEVVFTPHLVPMDRGILSTIYAIPRSPMTVDEVLEVLYARYAAEPFVDVVPHLPATKDVVGTNRCHITARVVRGRLVLVSVIDNLIKGASGAAVQNFNLMFGYDETTALL